MIAVDTHAHIFTTKLQLAEMRRYAPTYDATPEDYLAQMDANGIACGVAVQPSFLGTNNDYILDALRKYPDRLRGVAVVEPDIAAGRIDEMDALGMVGIRLNLQRLPIPNFSSGPWPALLGHLRRLDWQVEVIREGVDLPFMIEPLLDAGVNVVVDHFGRPEEDTGTDDIAFQYLLSRGSTRRVWVKLAAGYRNWPNDPDPAAGKPYAELLLQEFGPARLLWGSDWPNTQNEDKVDYASTLADLSHWVPSEADRRIILQDTAIRLFRFNEKTAG